MKLLKLPYGLQSIRKFNFPHKLGMLERLYGQRLAQVSDKCGSYGSFDDVRVGKNGYVYAYNDIAQLAAFINILSSNKRLRDKFSKKSREIALQSQQLAYVENIETLIDLSQSDDRRQMTE